ncbi:MAG: hypothetical protein IPM17_17110 [Verrucomicrobia bacterium]|nr:hypothetical protein [Verrucomicrobiota bacterium]
MRLKRSRSLVGFGVAVAACASALAGSATYDFTTDPANDPNFIIGTNNPDPWKPTGGNPGGYYAITESVNSQYSQILFPDFDNGLIVKAFDFEVDLRIGNAVGNSGRPADGFSINYARANDPQVQLMLDGNVTSTAGYAAPGAPETGTTTGIAISFDTWSGNTLPDGPDIEGIIVRVDNVTVTRVGLPTRNGACDDQTSLQTGPYNPDLNGDPSELCWQKFTVKLEETGELTVTYKGRTILDRFQTGYAPSRGRLLFGGRTGGANENHHVDNVKITTYAADKALYAGATADAAGYTITLEDSGQSQVVQSSIAVEIDGASVTPTSVSKDGQTTTVRVVTAPNWLASGSQHSVKVSFQDSLGNNLGGTRTATVAPYVDITPDLAVTGVNTAASNRGFLLRTWWLAVDETTNLDFDYANTVARAEQQLWGELGPNRINQPSDLNQTIPGTANKYAHETEYLNHDQAGQSQGMFQDFAADPQRQAPEKLIPGFDGFSITDPDNIACEALFFVEFTQAGLHTFGVNSDDGFAMYVGKNPLDRYQLEGKLLGQFDGGRGTDANNPQSLFTFLVRQPGIYPMRFIWFEGGGGASFEVYQRLADGSLALLNDTTRAANVVKTYAKGPMTPRAHITKVTVPSTFTGPVEIEIMDGDTSVVDGSVRLQVGGADVAATVTKTGQTTTVRYTPPGMRQWITGPNSVRLRYDETGGLSRDQTVTFNFQPGVDALPANSFTIEAEHFDNNGTAQISTGSGYEGGEYAGLAAVHNVDYYQDGNTPDQNGAYRAAIEAGLNPNVPMDSQTAAPPNLDTARPGFEVTTNYKIGWAGNGEWYNYTRTIPAGVYTAYAAHSIDPAGTAGGDLGLVTSGAGTANQTVKTLATIRGTPPGGWGNNGLLPAQDAAGNKAVFKLPGGRVTLRYTTRGGDFDWFTLSPTTAPASVTQAPDPRDSVRNDRVSWTVENFSTSVANGSVSLEVDGAAVPAADLETAYNADGATVRWTKATPGVHSYILRWSDGSPQSFASTMNVAPLPATGVFVIEAEDFNTGGGTANPQKGTAGRDVDVMPYLGGAYQGLSAVAGVDYNSDDGDDSNVYRLGETPNKNINDNLGGRWGRDRGNYEVTANYKLGWVNTADWGNYTRVIPAAKYEVWAALSYDGRSDNQLRATLGLVDNPAATSQTVTPLGSFNAPGSGGWGANNLVPMRDSGGSVAQVSLKDTTTFRFTMDSGDFDWFVLVPVGPYEEGGQPQFTSIRQNANGTITIEWTGGGTLQAAPAVTGPWQDVPGATSPFTFTPDQPAQFGRIRK